MKIRRDDQVIVISGKERGKKGKVLRTIPARERVIVEGLNMVKRHTKPTPQGDQGGVIEREAAIHVSNVMLVDPKDGRATRIASVTEDGKRYRVAKRSGTRLD
ncbi:MAG: 50S ribosomal protein L24 [Solirubrobacteraceae bacterium]|nr:MAG: 50S ribosomal protein L24 [Solirubrobacterales bacterium]